MALLHNRIKTNKSSYSRMKAVSFNAGKGLNLITIITLLILAINPRFLKIEEYITEFNGSIGEVIINPLEEAAKFTKQLWLNLNNFAFLQQQNIRLKMELARLEEIKAEALNVQQENIKLVKELKIATIPQDNFIKARLLYNSKGEERNIALIEAGTKHGIKVNQIATANGFLIGRVINVGKNYSKILLVNDYNSRISVKTSSSNIKAILVGNGQKGGRLLHIPSDQKPNLGEEILTSGDGKYFPRDLLVAKIHKIEGKEVTVLAYGDATSAEYVNIFFGKEEQLD